MALIRGFFLTIISVILFLGLIVVGLLNISSNSLEYENIQKNVVPALVGAAINNSSFSVSREMVNNSAEDILEQGISKQLEENYYEKKDCGNSCFSGKNAVFFLFSNQFKTSLDKYFYYSVLFCILLLILVFFLAENKSNAFLLSGILIFASGFGVFFLANFVIPFLYNFLFDFTQIGFVIPFHSFIAGVSSNFIWTILIGISLILVGVIIKMFSLGFIIEKFFERFKRDKQERVVEKPVENTSEEQVPQVSKPKKKKSKKKGYLFD